MAFSLRRRPAIVPLFVLVLALGALLLASCGAEEPTPACLDAQDGTFVPAECITADGDEVVPPPPPPPPPDNGDGETSGPQLFVGSGCGSCHTIVGISGGQLGPDLSAVGARADAGYIRESILDPSAVMAEVCPGDVACPDNVMPKSFGDLLSDAEIDALVAYLAGLK